MQSSCYICPLLTERAAGGRYDYKISNTKL